MLPSLFLAHGSPMLAIEQTPYTAFLEQLGTRYTPDAIVIFTAHWERETVTVSSHDNSYDTIYDFGGFPDELYQVTYPAQGSTAIANKVLARFQAAGIQAETDEVRGLDHGSWTLLHRMYPKAHIPVVQISVHPFLPAAQQYEIGRALQGLRQDNILIIGSGVTVHNLRAIRWGESAPEPWAVAFDDWLLDKLERGDLTSLFQYDQLAPNARQAVPRAEHFVPFFIALGSGLGDKALPIYRGYEMGNLSYLCISF